MDKEQMHGYISGNTGKDHGGVRPEAVTSYD